MPPHCPGRTKLRLDHLVIDQAKFLSPLSNSGYSDEDMMGKIKALAVKSTPQRLGFQILERYSAYTCCRWLRGGVVDSSNFFLYLTIIY